MLMAQNEMIIQFMQLPMLLIPKQTVYYVEFIGRSSGSFHSRRLPIPMLSVQWHWCR